MTLEQFNFKYTYRTEVLKADVYKLVDTMSEAIKDLEDDATFFRQQDAMHIQQINEKDREIARLTRMLQLRTGNTLVV